MQYPTCSFCCCAIFIMLSSCTKTLDINEAALHSFTVSNAEIPAIIGRQNLIKLPTGDYTYDSSNTLLWLPPKYNSTTKSYPLIINLYGQGQCNNDINTMLQSNTMCEYIAEGYNPVGHTISGQKKQYIVASPQCPVPWGWSAPHIKVMLQALKDAYRIDTRRIYLTGFSAGGWGEWTCITNDTSVTSQFAAIVNISSASADHPELIAPNAKNYSLAVWAVCGDQDAFYTHTVNDVNNINAASPPIPAVLTTLPGVGHSGWVYAYDPDWTDNQLHSNIYDWMIKL